MASYTITEARENLAEVIKKSAVEEVFLEKHGQAVAVVISPEVYERMLEAWEDIEDMKFAQTYTPDDEPGIPMEQVFRELGVV